MNNLRRGFLKTLGIGGLVSAGALGYKQATQIVYKQDELPTKELEEQIEKKPVLQLNATYGEELPPQTSNGYMFIGSGPQYKPGTEKRVEVKMVPGPDGKLYVKENDTWRKI
jgi:hypothetical protein